ISSDLRHSARACAKSPCSSRRLARAERIVSSSENASVWHCTQASSVVASSRPQVLHLRMLTSVVDENTEMANGQALGGRRPIGLKWAKDFQARTGRHFPGNTHSDKNNHQPDDARKTTLELKERRGEPGKEQSASDGTKILFQFCWLASDRRLRWNPS